MRSVPAFSVTLLSPQYWPWWLVLGVFALLAQLPYRVQLALGAIIGRLLYWVGRRRRHIAEVNIELCFPEYTPDQRHALVKSTLIAMGIGLIEQNMAWFMSRSRLQRLVQVDGLEQLEELGKQGALVVMRHTSTIQIAGVLASMHFPLSVMYRRHKNPVMEFVQHRGRTRMASGGTAFERKEVRTMLRFLREGEKVLYLPDQDYGLKQGVWAKFFNVSAATVTATSRFARMTKAAVVPMDFVRLPGGQGYKLTFSPPLQQFPSEDVEADVQRVNDLLESQIRATPEQYFWVHRRFKTRPEGEAPVY